jgi:hypothetical protein
MKQMTSGDSAVAAGGGELPAGAREAARRPLRELTDDRLLDALLERSRDQAGGLRLTGEGSMLGELIRAVLERALESELTAHLGYRETERASAEPNANDPSSHRTYATAPDTHSSLTCENGPETTPSDETAVHGSAWHAECVHSLILGPGRFLRLSLQNAGIRRSYHGGRCTLIP